MTLVENHKTTNYEQALGRVGKSGGECRKCASQLSAIIANNARSA